MKRTKHKQPPADFEVVTLSEIKSSVAGYGNPLDDFEHNAALLRGMKHSLSQSRYKNMISGTGFTLHKNTLDLWWGGYEYSIDLDEIDSPQKLIRMLAHIGQKTWPGMTPARISTLIQKLDKHFAWKMWCS